MENSKIHIAVSPGSWYGMRPVYACTESEAAFYPEAIRVTCPNGLPDEIGPFRLSDLDLPPGILGKELIHGWIRKTLGGNSSTFYIGVYKAILKAHVIRWARDRERFTLRDLSDGCFGGTVRIAANVIAIMERDGTFLRDTEDINGMKYKLYIFAKKTYGENIKN